MTYSTPHFHTNPAPISLLASAFDTQNLPSLGCNALKADVLRTQRGVGEASAFERRRLPDVPSNAMLQPRDSDAACPQKNCFSALRHNIPSTLQVDPALGQKERPKDHE